MAGQGRAGGYRRGDDGGQESFIACCLHGRPVSYRGFEDPPRAHPQGRRPERVISRAGERERKLKKREGGGRRRTTITKRTTPKHKKKSLRFSLLCTVTAAAAAARQPHVAPELLLLCPPARRRPRCPMASLNVSSRSMGRSDTLCRS